MLVASPKIELIFLPQFTSLVSVVLLSNRLIEFCQAVFEAFATAFWACSWQYGSFMSGLSSIGRLQTFLLAEEKAPTGPKPAVPMHEDAKRETSAQALEKSASRDAFSFLRTSIGYKATDIKILRDVSTQIPSRALTMIIGSGMGQASVAKATLTISAVACGKTTLLQSILGETDVLSGQITCHEAKPIAYC